MYKSQFILQAIPEWPIQLIQRQLKYLPIQLSMTQYLTKSVSRRIKCTKSLSIVRFLHLRKRTLALKYIWIFKWISNILLNEAIYPVSKYAVVKTNNFILVSPFMYQILIYVEFMKPFNSQIIYRPTYKS